MERKRFSAPSQRTKANQTTEAICFTSAAASANRHKMPIPCIAAAAVTPVCHISGQALTLASTTGLVFFEDVAQPDGKSCFNRRHIFDRPHRKLASTTNHTLTHSSRIGTRCRRTDPMHPISIAAIIAAAITAIAIATSTTITDIISSMRKFGLGGRVFMLLRTANCGRRRLAQPGCAPGDHRPSDPSGARALAAEAV